MKKLLIFGVGEQAEMAHFYFHEQAGYDACAFVVDGEYLTEETFSGHPVVAFEEASKLFPANEHEMFIAVGYSKMNSVRKKKFEEAKGYGYKLASYVSDKATTFSDFNCGENCFILEDNTIQPFVKIGSNVTLWSGNHIGHHSTICDNVFITSHVVVSGGVTVGDGSFIGVNSTIRDHINIGGQALIAAGSNLTKDAEALGVYMGNPAEKSRVPSNRLRNI